MLSKMQIPGGWLASLVFGGKYVYGIGDCDDSGTHTVMTPLAAHRISSACHCTALAAGANW